MQVGCGPRVSNWTFFVRSRSFNIQMVNRPRETIYAASQETRLSGSLARGFLTWISAEKQPQGWPLLPDRDRDNSLTTKEHPINPRYLFREMGSLKKPSTPNMKQNLHLKCPHIAHCLLEASASCAKTPIRKSPWFRNSHLNRMLAHQRLSQDLLFLLHEATALPNSFQPQETKVTCKKIFMN